jgi:hypothetical protein
MVKKDGQYRFRERSLRMLEICDARERQKGRRGKEEKTHLSNLLLMLRQQSLRRVLAETPLDHLLNPERLDTKQVENHRVGEAELGLELGGRAEDHVIEGLCLFTEVGQ